MHLGNGPMDLPGRNQFSGHESKRSGRSDLHELALWLRLHAVHLSRNTQSPLQVLHQYVPPARRSFALANNSSLRRAESRLRTNRILLLSRDSKSNFGGS